MKGGENVRKISKERAMSLNGGFNWKIITTGIPKIIQKLFGK